MSDTNFHVPVLIEEILGFFRCIQSDSPLKIFDGTLGGGGYTSRFLSKGWAVCACDLDKSAVANFEIDNRDVAGLKLSQANFANYIQEFEDVSFDGIVLDLGFSTNQLVFSDRGFSYLKGEEIFDLRYNRAEGETVWQKIAQLESSFDLQKIIYTYSGEKLSKRLAENLYGLIYKTQTPVCVFQVVQALTEAIPAKFIHQKNAILSRTWQALRIWTNKEFESLELFLHFAPLKLKPGGKLAIVCFHSLEDKIVTSTMRKLSRPYLTDDFGNTHCNFKLLTSKAITPSTEEVEQNIRSRSATLRVLEKKHN